MAMLDVSTHSDSIISPVVLLFVYVSHIISDTLDVWSASATLN